MKKLPYDNFNSQEFIVRDWLALDRTVLANERTFLAYGRTAIGLMLGGLTLIKLFHSPFAIASGWGFVGFALVVFSFGVQRFLTMQGHYRGLAALEATALPAELNKEFGLPINPPERERTRSVS
jgi:putative membrane protein